MADYSIDDILAELDAKKSGRNNAEGYQDREEPYSTAADDISATAILDGISGTDNPDTITRAIENVKSDNEKESEDITVKQLTVGLSDVDKVLSETDTFSISDNVSELFSASKAEAPAETEKPASKPAAAPVITEETPEQLEKRLKLEEESRKLLLQKERENTNPDDMLDLVNPLEVKQKVISEVKEQAEHKSGIAQLSDMYAGNTQGLDGNGIKKAQNKEAEDTGKVDSEGVKEYKSKAPADTLIERINKSIEQKREENVKAHRTITIKNVSTRQTAVAHPLNIDYAKQIVESTGALPSENPVVAQEKLEELSAAKKHKLKDFVLEDDTEEEIESEEENEVEEEFDDYDSTGQIWADLCASHKGLKLRAVLLAVITILSVVIGLLNDFDLFSALGLDSSFNFINLKGDVNALVYINLVLGVLGFAICSTVLSNGIAKLFTGRADCDSVCALSASLSIIGGVITLIDVQSFKLVHSFIYISTALVALLFNTLGKLYMISRAKRNFRFISGDSAKYYAQLIDNEASVSVLTRAATESVPVIATMRKTEFLTDFLKSSYCDDAADRLSVKMIIAAAASGVVCGLLAFLNPAGAQFPIDVGNAENPLFWAISSAIAVVSVASPFTMLLMINHPLNIASKQLNESGAALLGYESAEKFSEVNTVMIDAKTLFPAGSVVMHRIKRCQKNKSVIPISVEDAILMAASIAIHTDGILSYLFYDVTLGNKDLLQKVDNCIYEDNCGVTGWIGTKRVMLGGRQLMETHHIDIPSLSSEKKYCEDGFEPVYLAVSGEVVIMFVIGMMPNNEVADYLKSLQENGVSIIVRTTDSVVTVKKLSELFGIDPEYVSILPHDAHEEYNACTKYTSRGSGELSCGGTFTSFAKGILAAKSLARDFIFSRNYVIASTALGVLLTLFMVLFKQTSFLTPTAITAYNTLSALILLIIQKMRKY